MTPTDKPKECPVKKCPAGYASNYLPSGSSMMSELYEQAPEMARLPLTQISKYPEVEWDPVYSTLRPKK